MDFVLKPYSKLSRDELYDIMKLRQQVFVVEQDCPYLDCDDKDKSGYHLWMRDGGKDIMSYCRILPPNTAYDGYASIGRILTSEQMRNKGLASATINEAIRSSEQLFGKTPIKISAQHHLQKFYNSMGFSSVGNPYDEDGIEHIAMVYEYS